MLVFWVVTTYETVEKYKRFGATHFPHLQALQSKNQHRNLLSLRTSNLMEEITINLNSKYQRNSVGQHANLIELCMRYIYSSGDCHDVVTLRLP
jgi:hypothetical protein